MIEFGMDKCELPQPSTIVHNLKSTSYLVLGNSRQHEKMLNFIVVECRVIDVIVIDNMHIHEITKEKMKVFAVHPFSPLT